MDNLKEKTPEELVEAIQQACKLLGWNIAMDVRTTLIDGLVIGQSDYIERVLTGDDVNIDDYEIYGYAEDTAN